MYGTHPIATSTDTPKLTVQSRGPFNRKQRRILASAIRRNKPQILRAPHFSDTQRAVIQIALRSKGAFA